MPIPSFRSAAQPVQSVISNARGDAGFSSFGFPSQPAAHNIVLVFKDYSFGGTFGAGDGSSPGPIRATSGISGGISLPLPNNIQDTYSVKVGPDQIGVTGEILTQALSEGTSQTWEDIISDFSSAVEGNESSFSEIFSRAQQATRFFNRNVLETVGIGDGAISVGTGTAVNPHVALRFDGVDLKTHNFSWTLSPKNADEADELRNMQQYIRSNMAPEYVTDGAAGPIGRNLLRYPSLVDIYFAGLAQDYFYYFKPAFVQSFTVNYSPNGVALNKGGKPAVVNMSMVVQEARAHTREDFQ